MQNHSSDQSPTDAAHGKALLLLLLCVVLSVLANVYVANTDLIGRIAHAWPPIALALTAHIVWVVRGRSRWVTAITVALLVLVAAVAGSISYVGLQALATAANMSPLAAAWFPLTVDGLGLAAGIAFAAGRQAPSATATLTATDSADLQEERTAAALDTDPQPLSWPLDAMDPESETAEAETALVEDDTEAVDTRITTFTAASAAMDAPASVEDPSPDHQVEIVVDMLRNDPDLRAEEVQLYVPGVSSLRTAQRRLQAARQIIEAGAGRPRQLVAVH